MRSVVLLVGVVILISLTSRTATACSCGSPGTPCESFGSAAAVFVGTVTGVRDTARPDVKDVIERRKLEDQDEMELNPMAYKFSVEQPYLGVAGAEIEVFTGRGGAGDCGVSFQTGQRYLVYAYRYKTKLTTSICTRTTTFSRATEDLAFLGILSSAAPGVTIYGRVTRGPFGASGSEIKNEPLSPDVLITIQGESEQKEIRPDAEGRFRVNGLRPGKYKLTLKLPETLITPRTEQEINVADRGCGAAEWYIADNGRVNGRIINADGEPVAKILVSLVDPGANANGYGTKLARTNDEGYVSFSGVPPGTYHIAVNRNRYPNPQDPTIAYPLTFYPGVVDQRHAEAITVKAGEKLSDFEIRIPAKRPASTLIGTVVWSDGSPVADAELLVKDVTQNENSSNHGFAADGQGKFKIDGYTGQKLIIEARSNRPYVPTPGSNRFEPMERTEKLRITLEGPTQTLRIVITKLR